MSSRALPYWAIAFGLTQLVEVPIYMKLGDVRPFWKAFGASAWTHPIVWWPCYWAWRAIYVGWWGPTFGALELPGYMFGYHVLAETFAVVGEALYLRAFGVAHPWRWSAIANLTSASLGGALWLLGQLLRA